MIAKNAQLTTPDDEEISPLRKKQRKLSLSTIDYF